LIKPICFGSLRAPASVPDSLFAGGLIGSNLDKTAQSGFDRGPLGSSASRLHRLPHQLVVDVDIRAHGLRIPMCKYHTIYVYSQEIGIHSAAGSSLHPKTWKQPN